MATDSRRDSSSLGDRADPILGQGDRKTWKAVLRGSQYLLLSVPAATAALFVLLVALGLVLHPRTWDMVYVAFTAPTPVQLIGEFKSYQTISDVHETLRRARLSWTVEEDRRILEHHIHRLGVHRFSDLDHEGALRLDFFDNQLLAAIFVPENFEGYLRQLRVERGLAFDRPSLSVGVVEAGTNGRLSVWANRNPAMGKPFVGWNDVRLQRARTAAID